LPERASTKSSTRKNGNTEDESQPKIVDIISGQDLHRCIVARALFLFNACFAGISTSTQGKKVMIL